MPVKQKKKKNFCQIKYIKFIRKKLKTKTQFSPPPKSNDWKFFKLSINLKNNTTEIVTSRQNCKAIIYQNR